MDDARLWFSLACVLLAYAAGRRRALTPQGIADALDRPIKTTFYAGKGTIRGTLELGDGLELNITASGVVAERIARRVLELPQDEPGQQGPGPGAPENG